jgi:cell division protein FtsX
LYGIISGFIVLAALYPLCAWLGPASQAFLGNFNVFSYYLSSFWLLFLVVMASGIALGTLSSFLAVRRYLNI